MKIDCGKTPSQRREEKIEAANASAARLLKWHRTFAWIPIRLGPNDCRWLEFIERRYGSITFDWGILGIDIECWNVEYRGISK